MFDPRSMGSVVITGNFFYMFMGHSRANKNKVNVPQSDKSNGEIGIISLRIQDLRDISAFVSQLEEKSFVDAYYYSQFN